MEEFSRQELSPHTAGFGVAAAIAILFNTLLAWLKDSHPAVQNAMKDVLGHHWITHGVLVASVFAVLGFGFSRSAFVGRLSGKMLAIIIFSATVLGGLGLVGWFFFA